MVASFMDPVDMQQVAIENKETTVIADELLTSQFLTTTQKPSPERKTTKNPLKIGLQNIFSCTKFYFFGDQLLFFGGD